MVQATSPAQGSGRDGFRVGASHDAPARTAVPASPGGTRRLPPIVWVRVDRRKILVEDLVGTGKSVALALLGFAVLIAVGVGIALVVTTVLNALGLDPSSLY